MIYFNENDSLYYITEKFPETIPVFTSNGFEHLENKGKREQLGKSISLKIALMMKNIDYKTFSNLLIEAIEDKSNYVDPSLQKNQRNDNKNAINIVGLLPCPVRLPLLENFTNFITDYKKKSGLNINYELKAASSGLEWVEKNIKGIENIDALPDLFISAGFDMFFDEDLIGKFKKNGDFKDLVKLGKFNDEFEAIKLRDPKLHYSMIGVVPAVFLINTEELGDLPTPKTWSDIMKPEFEKRVSLPVGDFDLFNGILLNIFKNFGSEGVKKIGRSLLESLHPAEMVKSNRKKNNRPIVTIMPYFFTKMVKEGGTMQAIWPEDGAIISPIFLLSKKNKHAELQPIIDFFASKEVGEILSHNGLFPSVHPDIDNRIPSENKYQWLGWDYIYKNNISKLISYCEKLFEEAITEEVS